MSMRVSKKRKNVRGIILVNTLFFSLLMVLVSLAGSNMIMQDVRIVETLKFSTQARYLAEAGINAALAQLADNTFNLTIFPLSGAIGADTYLVTASQAGGRTLLSSVGTVTRGAGAGDDVSRTVSAEVQNLLPTSMNFIMSATADLDIRAGFASLTDINGDIHGNNRVALRTGLFLGFMRVTGTATYTTDNVYIDVFWFSFMQINGGLYGNNTHITQPGWSATALTFPVFDYAFYKQEAMAGGIYFAGNANFDSQTISPGNGLVYVEGTATFEGTCTLNGGIVADVIQVNSSSGKRGRLNQNAAGNFNVIVSRTGDITVGNQDGGIRRPADLNAGGALIYAQGDFETLAAFSIIDVNGVITANNIKMREFIAYIDYDYAMPAVSFGPNVATIRVVSWNR